MAVSLLELIEVSALNHEDLQLKTKDLRSLLCENKVERIICNMFMLIPELVSCRNINPDTLNKILESAYNNQKEEHEEDSKKNEEEKPGLKKFEKIDNKEDVNDEAKKAFGKLIDTDSGLFSYLINHRELADIYLIE